MWDGTEPGMYATSAGEHVLYADHVAECERRVAEAERARLADLAEHGAYCREQAIRDVADDLDARIQRERDERDPDGLLDGLVYAAERVRALLTEDPDKARKYDARLQGPIRDNRDAAICRCAGCLKDQAARHGEVL